LQRLNQKIFQMAKTYFAVLSITLTWFRLFSV
jgi:hypothetical protein